MKWPSQTKERTIQPELEPLGRALLRGTWKEIASAVYRVKEIRSELIKCMLKQLSVECCDIISSKRPSLLRKTTASDIRKLSLANICHEMKERAPLLYSVMMTTATPNRKKYDATEWLPSVAIAAAVLLKQRCRMVNSVQLLIMTIIKFSRFQVYLVCLTTCI